jgi:hypothetical protein
MIPFERVPEPPDFDARVRRPGREWLAGGKKGTPGYWRRTARDLRAAFKELCAYSAMWLSTPGTVDHFISRNEDRSLAYEWTNFRYAAAWINSSKSALRADQLVDPFDVGEDWFEVLLPSCQMVMTDRCPPELRDRARTMLTRLKLGDGEAVLGYRQEWYRMYTEGELTLEGLARKAPLLARAARKRAERHRGVVRSVVEEHARRTNEPLVLAVWYRRRDPLDLHLLEVIEGSAGGDEDPLLTTAFRPTAGLAIQGKLRLTRASPAQLRAAIARGDEVVRALRHDGDLLHPSASEQPPAAELLAGLGLRPGQP